MQCLYALCGFGALLASTEPSAQIASDGSIPGRNKFDSVEIVSRPHSDNELRKRSLVAKRIYGRGELDRFGDATLADVLSNLPNVQIVNGSPALSGMDPRYTKILVNGDPVPSGLTMEQINPALVERIEITRNQQAHQSSQAIAGTINIILKDAPSRSQRSVRYGFAYQNERPTPSVTYTLGETAGDVSVVLPFSVQEMLQTFQVNSDNHVVALDGGVSRGYQEKYWRYGHVFLTFNPRLTYTVNDDEKIVAQAFLQASDRRLLHRFARTILSGDPQLDYDFRSQTDVRLASGDIAWSKNISNTERLSVKFGLSSRLDGGCAHISLIEAPIGSRCGDRVDLMSRVAASYQSLVADSHAIAVGLEFEKKKQTEWQNESYLGAVVNPLVAGSAFIGKTASSALYVQDDWEVNKALSLGMGVRVETVRLTADVPAQLVSESTLASGGGSESNLINPILNFAYRPNPDSSEVIRGGVSRGFKAPEIWAIGLMPGIRQRDPSAMNSALNPDFVGNSNLRTEIAANVDLSYERSVGNGGFVSVGTFYRQIDDLLVDVVTQQGVYWASSPRWVSQAVNVPRANTYGIEVELKGPVSSVLPPNMAPKHPLNLRLNANYYGSHVEGVPGPNNRLPKQYPWTLTLGVDYKPSESLTLGASHFISPAFERLIYLGYEMQQSRLSWTNAFVQYKVDKTSSVRIGLNNLFPSANSSGISTTFSDQRSNRMGRTSLTVTFERRL